LLLRRRLLEDENSQLVARLHEVLSMKIIHDVIEISSLVL